MPRRLMVLAVIVLRLTAWSRRLEAQRAWKPILEGSKPTRVVPWRMLVDTQRVDHNTDGSYTVFLRWSVAADSVNSPRVDRVERRRVDCKGEQSMSLSLQRVQVRNGRDAEVTNVPVADSVWSGFDAESLEREFLGTVCSWLRRSPPQGRG